MRSALRWMVAIQTITAGALVAASVHAADESAFLIDEMAFDNQITSIAVAPLNVVSIFELTDATIEMLETETMRLLAKKKLEALPIDVYRGIRDVMSDRVGGIRNTEGVYDAVRVATVWDHSKREVLLRHAVNAILTVSVTMVNAPFENDRAEWDGVKQSIDSQGRGNFSGTIRAASIHASIVDRQDNLLFAHSGGIEVLQDRVDAQLIPRPKEEMLKDDKRLLKALQIALDPL